jgi:hypothetical protein
MVIGVVAEKETALGVLLRVMVVVEVGVVLVAEVQPVEDLEVEALVAVDLAEEVGDRDDV